MSDVLLKYLSEIWFGGVFVDFIIFSFYDLPLSKEKPLKATWRKPCDKRMAQRGDEEGES